MAALASGGGDGGAGKGPSGGGGGGGGGDGDGKGKGDDGHNSGDKGPQKGGLFRGWEERVAYDSEFPIKVQGGWLGDRVAQRALGHSNPSDPCVWRYGWGLGLREAARGGLVVVGFEAERLGEEGLAAVAAAGGDSALPGYHTATRVQCSKLPYTSAHDVRPHDRARALTPYTHTDTHTHTTHILNTQTHTHYVFLVLFNRTHHSS